MGVTTNESDINNKELAENIMVKFNEYLDSVITWNQTFGGVVCDILKPKFTEYKFDTRIQGWEWFFLDGIWIRFYLDKTYNNSITIKGYDFYEPFYE